MPETEMDMQACMQAAVPGEGHERLNQFEGTWRAVVKLWMAPGAEPMENAGTMTNSWQLDKRFLKQAYKQDDGQFEGTGYWGFNNHTGEYEGLWIDTMSTGMMNETGSCDAAGKVWTMTGEADVPGGKKAKKSVITVADENHHTMEMYFGGPDGGEFKVMEIQNTRA